MSPFKGVIDGNGHSIYGLRGTHFIGYLDTSAKLMNVNFYVDSLSSFIYENKGNINNVNNYGVVINGIVYNNYGEIRYCRNVAKSSIYRSGIAYFNRKSGVISNCENDADNNNLSGADSLGGIAVVNYGMIDSSKSRVSVTYVRNSKEQYSNVIYYARIGGISAENAGIIRNSSAKISVNGLGSTKGSHYIYVGGIAGINGAANFDLSYEKATIENIYDTKLEIKKINAGNYLLLGGIAGKNSNGKINSAQSTLYVKSLWLNSSSSYANGLTIGGLAGTSNADIRESYGNLSIDSVYIKGAYSADDYYIGGLVGLSKKTLRIVIV